MANVAANLIRKFAELLPCFLGNEELVSHWAEVYQLSQVYVRLVVAPAFTGKDRRLA